MKLGKQTGFTIVELLIVVVVIAILAAITIVTYNGVKNRAADTAAAAELSNITKQIIAKKATGETVPGYDAIAARSGCLGTGGAGMGVYSFAGMTDSEESWCANPINARLSPATALSRYGVKVGPRAGFIATTVPTGYGGQYVLAAMGVAFYSSENSVPREQRVLRYNEPILSRLSGWYKLEASGMRVDQGNLVCNGGGTLVSHSGTNWSDANDGGHVSNVARPYFSNGQVTVSASSPPSMAFRRAYVGCNGGSSYGGGTLTVLAVNTTYSTNPDFGVYPLHDLNQSVNYYNP